MVVIAALFTAFAVVAAVAIDRNSVTKQFNQQAAARAQIQRLENAVLKYYVLNNSKYPCPARYDLATTNAAYGTENSASSTGTTNNCATSLAASGIDVLKRADDSTDSADIRGMVPITTLSFYGADLSDAIDPWGNRIMYVVHRQLTSVGTGTAACSGTATCGAGTAATDRPSIADGITTRVINSADFVIISYGPDKLGGIAKNSTAASISCPAPGTASTDIRMENCDGDMMFVYRPPYTAPNATATGTYKRYDDIIGFYAAQ